MNFTSLYFLFIDHCVTRLLFFVKSGKKKRVRKRLVLLTVLLGYVKLCFVLLGGGSCFRQIPLSSVVTCRNTASRVVSWEEKLWLRFSPLNTVMYNVLTTYHISVINNRFKLNCEMWSAVPIPQCRHALRTSQKSIAKLSTRKMSGNTWYRHKSNL